MPIHTSSIEVKTPTHFSTNQPQELYGPKIQTGVLG